MSASSLMRVGAMMAGLEEGARLRRVGQCDALRESNAALRSRVASLRFDHPVESAAAPPKLAAELRRQLASSGAAQDDEFARATRAREDAREERRGLEEAAVHATQSLAVDLRGVATEVQKRTDADAADVQAHDAAAAIAAWDHLESSMRASEARIAAAEMQFAAMRTTTRHGPI